MHINGYPVKQHEIGVMERRAKHPRNSEEPRFQRGWSGNASPQRRRPPRWALSPESDFRRLRWDEAPQADRMTARTEGAKPGEHSVIQFGWTMVLCGGASEVRVS